MAKITMLREDGATKVIDLAPWGGIDGFLSATSTGAGDVTVAKLRGLVPWMQRAIGMTANAISTIPFSVVTANGDEIDTSSDWKNIRGGIANPSRLIYLVASSLCSGAAYLRVAGTRSALADVRYMIPGSITPEYGSDGQVLRFRRQDTRGKAQVIPIEEIIYFWLPDDSVETGPANIHPVKNASLSAELLGQMDSTLRTYGQNGFIPPMILSAKGLPSKSEAEKAEKWWNLFLRGRAGVAKIFNAESITPQAVGAGMAEMRGSYIQITRQQIENIGAAFGIPAGVFMSNAANYATALADRRNWYESGIFVLLYQTIQEVLTDQLFSRFELRFQFNINGLDAFQEDEVSKASSFGAYVSAGLPKSLAAELVGLDMPQGWDYSMLDPAPVAAVEQAAVVAPPLNTTQADAIANEIMSFRRFSQKRIGKPDIGSFNYTNIPLSMVMQIQARLKSGYSDDIFVDALKDIPLYILAEAINGQ